MTAQAQATLPPWQQRFYATRFTLPSWARQAPHRTTYSTNASGVRQLWSWDTETDRHTQLTHKRTGVSWGVVSPDGEGVIWFDDTGGDEVGRFVVTPFHGGDTTPLVPTVDEGWAAGIAVRADVTAIGRADSDGFAIVVADRRGTRTIVERQRPVIVSGLSADGTLLALSHTELGDVLHPTAEVVDTDGGPIAAADDGLGNTVDPAGWSPVPGDTRIALVVDRSGRSRVEIWDVGANQRVACDTDLPGEVDVEDWWPDGSALLLAHSHHGQRSLLRYDIDGATSTPIELGVGTVSAASVRPDGTLWYVFESTAIAPTVRARAAADDVLLSAPAATAPNGAGATTIRLDNGDGGKVEAFLVLPDGTPPHPLVVDVHGGPHAQVGDAFDPFVQAWVDHGFAVCQPNYRGSTGYGKHWQDALEGDPGRPELVDVLACRDHLVATGVADVDRIVLVGASWGGYLTLQGIGTQPTAWSAAIATVPVADYIAAYEDESPGLRQFDRGLFGCTPDECPDLYRERSPITYVPDVRAPVLIITGANDTRCPKRQVDNYVAALREHDIAHRYDVFEAGHGSMAITENVRQQALSLDFIAEHLGTTPAQR